MKKLILGLAVVLFCSCSAVSESKDYFDMEIKGSMSVQEQIKTGGDLHDNEADGSFTVRLETLANLTQDFRVGLGVGYGYLNDPFGDFTNLVNNKDYEIDKGYDIPTIQHLDVYGIARYHLFETNNSKVYLRGSAGYSFYSMDAVTTVTILDYKNNPYKDKEVIAEEKHDTSIQDNLFFDIGLGWAYKDMIFETYYQYRPIDMSVDNVGYKKDRSMIVASIGMKLF